VPPLLALVGKSLTSIVWDNFSSMARYDKRYLVHQILVSWQSGHIAVGCPDSFAQCFRTAMMNGGKLVGDKYLMCSSSLLCLASRCVAAFVVVVVMVWGACLWLFISK
jgi:hypothetical protein